MKKLLATTALVAMTSSAVFANDFDFDVENRFINLETTTSQTNINLAAGLTQSWNRDQ